MVLADQALVELETRQDIITHWPADYDRDRFEGVDFMVTRRDGVDRPLQVKSSWSGFYKAREYHPEIPCIVVEAGDTVETIMANIMIVIGRK